MYHFPISHLKKHFLMLLAQWIPVHHLMVMSDMYRGQKKNLSSTAKKWKGFLTIRVSAVVHQFAHPFSMVMHQKMITLKRKGEVITVLFQTLAIMHSVNKAVADKIWFCTYQIFFRNYSIMFKHFQIYMVYKKPYLWHQIFDLASLLQS